MLRQLKLTCFRKHEDLTIKFDGGLNVLRGANEAGKSTIIEAVLYALYGAKSLRDSLAETVTWGHKENELRVELTLNVNGKDYTFKRSKGGASVYYEQSDVMACGVIGQTEVATFAADLLGADAKTASLLMMAGQNDMRGAIDNGPAAVSGLMAKLADFDLLDKLVVRAEATLPTGNTVALKARIDELKVQIEKLDAEAPDPTLALGYAEVRRGHLESAEAVNKELIEIHRPALERANETLNLANALVAELAENKQRQESWTTQIERARAAMVEGAKVIQLRPAPEALEAARKALHDNASVAKLVEAYNRIQGLGGYPETFWDEPKAKLVQALDLAKDAHGMLTGAFNALKLQAGQARAKRITKGGQCPTCGTVTMTEASIAAHNQAHDAEATELDRKAAVTKIEIDNHQAEIDQLAAVLANGSARDYVATQFEGHDRVKIDRSVYPPRIEWIGDEPQAKDTRQLRTDLQRLEDAERAAVAAQAKNEQHQETINIATEQLAHLTKAASGIELPDLVALRNAADLATYAVQKAETCHNGFVEAAREALAKEIEAKQMVELHEASVRAARDSLRKYQQDLTSTEFNNLLLSKLKKLKPIITDHLWNSVLAAVSNFFTTLRGEPSVVSKDGSGFKVNGKSVDSLSGSTLDVLALAVRVALTKTFIPHAGFIVLDEPAHGCDTERTGNVLGFLSSVGFKQTLLASHDELSEAVADNVIAIGA